MHHLYAKLSYLATAAAAATLFGVLGAADTARADGWPSSVTGNWSMRANLSTTTLTISTQSSSGQCRSITGFAFGAAIEGFYCPQSGRIGFVRKATSSQSSAPVQYYEGQLSQDSGNDFIAGTFAVWTAGASPGLYNFSASR